MLRILILSVVTASAGRVSQNFRDHHLAQPKTDFSAFSQEQFGFDTDRPFAQIGGSPDRHYEHREFETQFSHREFHQDSNGEKKDFGFKGRNFGVQTSGDESLRREFQRPDFKPHDAHFNREGKDLGLEMFNNEREQGSIGHRHVGDRDFRTLQEEFQNRFGGDSFNPNFQGRMDDRNIDTRNRFEESGMTRNYNNRESVNRETEIRDRNRQDVDSQRNRNKEQFEIIATDNQRIFETENRRRGETVSLPSIMEQDPNSTNYLRTNEHSSNRNSPGHTKTNQGQKDIYNINNTDMNKTNQKPDIKTTTENEIPHKVQVNNPNETRNNRPDMEDVWVWGVEEGKKTTTTESPANVTLDDRASFTGDKCPTGKIKVNNLCVDVD